MNKPRGLSNDELRTVMGALRSVPRQHRGWALQEGMRELERTTSLNEALSAAIERLEERAE